MIIKDGRYAVTVLGGLGNVLNKLGDEKVVDGKVGHNVIDGKEWGWFHISRCKVHGADRVKLNYDHPNNPRALRFVIDYLREDLDGGWVGYLTLAGITVLDFRLVAVEAADE